MSIPEILIKGKPSDGGGCECWEGGKIEQKRKKKRELMDMDMNMVIAGGRWVGEDIEVINGDGKIK